MMTMQNNTRLLNLMTVGLLVIGTAPGIAQSTTNLSPTIHRTLNRVLFKPPPEDKKPEHTIAAGSRGRCPQDDIITANLVNSQSSQNNLIALVPSNSLGLTISEHPILWIYLPETSAKQVVLSIQEEGKIHHSKTYIPITGSSGIVSLRPSPNSPPLEVGKNYRWSVVLVCGQKETMNDPGIASWVRRVDLTQPTNHGTVLEQASWYGEQGIWYDALTSVVEAERSQPHNQDLFKIRANFLQSAGLEMISTQPVQF